METLTVFVIGSAMVVYAALAAKYTSLPDYDLPFNLDGKSVAVSFLLGVGGIFVLGLALILFVVRKGRK